jgi:hypothetical protein
MAVSRLSKCKLYDKSNYFSEAHPHPPVNDLLQLLPIPIPGHMKPNCFLLPHIKQYKTLVFVAVLIFKAGANVLFCILQ